MTETLKYHTVNMVDCHDFDALASEVFNRPYNTGRAEDNPAQNTIVPVDPSWLLEDEEEMAYAQERFDNWMAMPATDDLTSVEFTERYATEEASPPVNIMVLKLREKGVKMPEKFSIEIWW